MNQRTITICKKKKKKRKAAIAGKPVALYTIPDDRKKEFLLSSPAAILAPYLIPVYNRNIGKLAGAGLVGAGADPVGRPA